jgi:hypothetical protein
MKHLHLTALLALTLLFSRMVFALDFDEGRIQIHGFATQGAVMTTDNNFYGKSDDSISFDFHEIGLNASYRPLANLQFSVQGVHIENGNVDEHRFLLDYGLVDYTVFSNEDWQFGVRAGRVKNPFGLYTKTRDVAFTRPSIILPQSIYWDNLRSLALSSDGGGFYASYESLIGSFDLDVVHGNSIVDRGTEALYMQGDQPGDMESDRPMTVARLMYTSPDYRLRLGFTWTDLNIRYDPAKNDPYPIHDYEVHVRPWVASAQYTYGPWEFTGEYSQMSFEDSGYIPTPFGNFDYQNKYTIEGYYLQGSYWITPDFQILLRYDEGRNDKDDHYGKRLAAKTGVPANLFYSKDWTVGLRYDVTQNLMLRTEWHHVEGTGWLSSLDNPNPQDRKRDWDMFMFLVSWRF